MRVGEHDLLSEDETERDLSIANIFIVSISTPTHSVTHSTTHSLQVADLFINSL